MPLLFECNKDMFSQRKVHINISMFVADRLIWAMYVKFQFPQTKSNCPNVLFHLIFQSLGFAKAGFLSCKCLRRSLDAEHGEFYQEIKDNYTGM